MFILKKVLFLEWPLEALAKKKDFACRCVSACIPFHVQITGENFFLLKDKLFYTIPQYL